jgi:ABC-type multidrug transport system fused ATPase/permease subunit
MSTIYQFALVMLRRFYKQFILLLLIILIQVLFTSLSIIAIAPIVDIMSQVDQSDQSFITKFLSSIAESIGFSLEIWNVLFFYGFISLLVGISGLITEYFTYRIKYSILRSLLTDTLSSFFKAKLLFFTQGDVGEILNSFQQEMSKIGNSIGLMASLCSDIIQAFVLLLIPFMIAPKVTTIFFITVIFLSIPMFAINKITHGFGEASTKTSNHFSGVLHEAITSAKLILSFAKQKMTINRFDIAFKEHANAAVKLQTLSSGLPRLFAPLMSIAALLACYYAYIEKIPLSNIAVVLFALIRLSPVIGKLIESKVTMVGYIPAFEQVERLTNEANNLLDSFGSLKFDKLTDAITLNKVNFRFPERKKIINDLTMRIEANKTLAIVGQSGAGKTTLIDLILGLHTCEDGDILFDNENIQQYNINSIRESVGYVTQEAQLFNMSIRENLLWSYSNATEEDIWSACKTANAEIFIKDLPNGLDTQLGDRGTRLSGGQRQRLALARAIIKSPEILILDEATSSLDSESESLIRKSIESLSGKMTIIIIAHRLSTIKNSDYIYVLKDGEVLESGSYNQLSTNLSSKLSSMIESQNI